jgi:putative transposase
LAPGRLCVRLVLEPRLGEKLTTNDHRGPIRLSRRHAIKVFAAGIGGALLPKRGALAWADLWADIFADLARRGLDPAAVELGIMDGLPGLEEAFRRCFPRAQTQRCQVHAKRNALRRVRKSDRPALSAALSQVFYVGSESETRQQFYAFREQWQPHFPGAVAVIERDLDSLLRFFQFAPTYWATIRTTNPIERLNKEFKRRTKAMEVTGGEASTYRILTYVAMTMEHEWSFHRVTRWSHAYPRFSGVYTHDAA